jgi:hypothetical protein
VNRDDALEFLRQHQPMPNTGDCDQNTLDGFDEVRRFFLVHPDDSCVPLLLHSFGGGDLHGIYQLVEDTVLAQSEEAVIPALVAALGSQSRDVRCWCAEIAANYKDKRLLVPLGAMLKSFYSDEREVAKDAIDIIETG